MARVDIRTTLGAATGLPVHIENSVGFCSRAIVSEREEATVSQLRLHQFQMASARVVVNANYFAPDHIAGEFGHMPINVDVLAVWRPNGCWETYTSNLATLSRYLAGICPNIVQKA